MPPDPAADAEPAPKSTLRTRLALATGSLLVAVVLVAALEGALRLTRIGQPVPWSASRLEYQHYSPPLLRPARLPDGTAVLRTVDPRLSYQSILAEKPADGLRVLCFGGSATAGLGFSPNVSFPRALEDMLRAALPGRSVEVVNLGIVAFSSAQVHCMVTAACQRYAPDLMVVYCGNNEFLEIHARKYAARHGHLAKGLRDWLADTNLYRLLLGIDGQGAPATVSEATGQEMRLSEAELIEDIEMSAETVAGILDAYEANFDAMAERAVETRVPLLLMAVATNWRWCGREDLPEGWVEELLAEDPGTPIDDVQRARGVAILDGRLVDPARSEWHLNLYRRAVLHEALGDEDAARRDFRTAVDADPHLRRALGAMNERVAAVARRRGVDYLDTVELLAAAAPGGVLGFGEFYDYVHFTPRGALLVAAGIFQRMRAMGLVPAAAAFDPEAFAHAQIDELVERSEDFLAVDRWLGFCDDRGMLADRDLWKYDKMLARLDKYLAANPGDARALVWRGNARSFLQDGLKGAADYRAALALEPDLEPARANLAALLRKRGLDQVQRGPHPSVLRHK